VTKDPLNHLEKPDQQEHEIDLKRGACFAPLGKGKFTIIGRDGYLYCHCIAYAALLAKEKWTTRTRRNCATSQWIFQLIKKWSMIFATI